MHKNYTIHKKYAMDNKIEIVPEKYNMPKGDHRYYTCSYAIVNELHVRAQGGSIKTRYNQPNLYEDYPPSHSMQVWN